MKRSVCLAALVLGATACSSGGQSSSAPAAASAATPAAPVVSPPPTVGADVPLADKLNAAAERYARNMIVAEGAMHGTLAEGANQQQLIVLGAGVCHTIVGVASDGVTDLDLVLEDQNAVVVQRDVSKDALPILGLASPICPQQPTSYRLEARMVSGSGQFSVQVYRTRS